MVERCQILESAEPSRASVKIETKPHNQFYQNKTDRQTRGFFVQNRNCPICNGDFHWLSKCSKFLKLNENQRISEIKRLHLCLNCFKAGHLSSRCIAARCSKCNKPHNVLLHLEFPSTNRDDPGFVRSDSANEIINQRERGEYAANVSTIERIDHEVKIVSKPEDFVEGEGASFSTHMSNVYREGEVLLSTAKLLVVDNNGKSFQVRALPDCGSQSSFVSKETVMRLGVKCSEVNMSIVGVNSLVSKCSRTVSLTICSKFNKFSERLNFLVLDKIANSLPIYSVNRKVLQIPTNINLADDTFDAPDPIDMLLGADIFYDLLLVGQIRTAVEMPILQKTKLGWIVSGGVPAVAINRNVSNNFSQVTCSFSEDLVNLHDQMERLWQIDEPQLKRRFLKREKEECEELFTKTTYVGDDGHYIVELPTKKG